MSTITSAMPHAWRGKFESGDEGSIRLFSRLIGDFNPIHHNTEAARKQGLAGIVAPGVMIMGFVSASIAEHIPGVMVRKIEIKLSNPLYANCCAVVECQILSTRGRIAKASFSVKAGEALVVDGECLLLLPV